MTFASRSLPDSMHQPPQQNATMTSNMQLFTERIGEQSVAISATLVGYVPWFRGNDVAAALGHKNTRQAMRTHVHEEDRRALEDLGRPEIGRRLEHNEGAQVYINESGVYSLIMRSKKAEARLFQRWVTNEVLPSIRRTGQYSSPTPPAGAESVEDASRVPSPYELEMARSARMQALTSAYAAAHAIGSSSRPRLEAEVQKGIDDMLLPRGDTPDQWVDAETILRERGHDDRQIARLASELGKDLKLVALSEERTPVSREGYFGAADRHQVGLYHRVKDAPLIEDVLSSFRRRDVYARVLAGHSDPVHSKRQQLLDAKGRGRSRLERR